jgi:hypothetical protein
MENGTLLAIPRGARKANENLAPETSKHKYAHNNCICYFCPRNFPKLHEMVLNRANEPPRRTKNWENVAMTTQIHHETAQILQFRPREAATRNASHFSVKSGRDTEAVKVSVMLSCDSWYHEAAIRGDGAPRKS